MVCVFPGSFTKFHNGHKFVINSALNDGFSKVIVLISINMNKPKHNLLDIYNQIKICLYKYLELNLVEVIINYGYTSNFMKENNLEWIVRGYRNRKDFLYEKKLYQEYLKQNPNISLKLYKSPKELKKLRSSTLTIC